MTDDTAWFRERIAVMFGDGAQSAFARFLRLAGDPRHYSTIIRAINGYANGRHPLPGEMRAILEMAERPERIKEMIRQAKREPDPPAFKLRPALA